MSEEDLELLITTDDPGEDTLEEDTFHDKATARPSGGRGIDVSTVSDHDE